jgi:hypothetical protein
MRGETYMHERVQKMRSPPGGVRGLREGGIGLTRMVRCCGVIQKNQTAASAYRNQLPHNICNWLDISPDERANFCLITTECYFSVIR